MNGEERRPALALIALGMVLGLLGVLPDDRRIAIVLWLVAVPMIASGGIALAWGNAAREFQRLRSGRQ